MHQEAFEPYLAHLRQLPFVRRAQLDDKSATNQANSQTLTLTTPQGQVRAFLDWSRSNLSQRLVDHVIHFAAQSGELHFLFAPAVAGATARRLAEAHINYVDLAGNCRIQLGDDYVAQIEGRKLPVKAPRERALRAPSLQVLFTLLEDPKLINSPVREIAAATGSISPQTVSDLRKRLVVEEWVTAARRKHTWVPGGKERALDLLLGDYDRLAHHLLLGRYRARPMDLKELEQELEARLKAEAYSFGGGAALNRINGFYRGTRTIVYLERAIPSMTGLLVPDERGEVIFSRFPGTSARNEKHQVSPLLIYLDLMMEGEPRAREAAAELRSTLFGEDDDEA